MSIQATYLIGAGASYHSVPIVERIEASIQEAVDIIKSIEAEHYSGIENYQLTKNQLVDDLLWLKNKCSQHASLDTYAKKLYLRGEKDVLHKLKAVLTIFLVFHQEMHESRGVQYQQLDQRYDSFLASILNELTMFPEGIKVLNWNYDYQLAMAYSAYIDNNQFGQLIPRLKMRFGRFNEPRSLGFEVIQLNGIAMMQNSSGRLIPVVKDINIRNDQKLLSNIVNAYAAVNSEPNKFSSAISFAWESNRIRQEFLTNVSSQVSSSKALVIVGYSLPYFNREIDSMLINSMKDLQKVYIQNKTPLPIKESFTALWNGDISQITFQEISDPKVQFVIPNELG